MKKRLFSLMLVAALVMGMLVAPVAAAPTQTATAPSDTYEADVWYEADSANRLQNLLSKDKSTNFLSVNDLADSTAETTVGIRLTANVSTEVDYGSGKAAVFYIGHYNDNDKTDRWPMKIVLDLNGHTITDTSKNLRMFGIYSGSTLVITNGTIIANGCYYSNGNLFFSSGSNNVTLDGVRIVSNSTATAADYSTSVRDRVVGGMYRVSGNLAIKNCSLEKNSGYTNNGGILSIAGGSKVTLEKSIFKTNTSVEVGGCIHTEGTTTTVTATDCVFLGNSVAPIETAAGTTNEDTTKSDDGCGGTIFNTGTMTLTNCIVSGGTAATQGGNIVTTGTLNLVNTDVEAGNCDTFGDNLYVSSKGTLNMSSGAVDGGVLCLGTANLSGTAQITCGDLTGIRFEENAIVKITDLEEGAKLVVSGSAAVTESPDLAAYLDSKTVIGAAKTTLALADDTLTATAADTDVYCAHCGETVTWTAFTADTCAGHCYLSEGGLALTTENTGMTVAADTSLVLDLNGQTLELSGSREIAGALTVLDTAAAEGKIFRSTADNAENGGLLRGADGSTITLCGGTLQGITVSGDRGGGTIYTIGSLYIYGGTVTGGATSGAEDVVKYGGNILVDNNLTCSHTGGLYMYGGTVRDGVAHTAGNIFVTGAEKTPATKFIMHGGLIRNGKTQVGGGGNVYLFHLYNSQSINVTLTDDLGYAIMDGGIIADGTAASHGGNLYGSTGTILYFRGGVITGGNATNYGGNYYASSTNARLVINGGWFNAGTSGSSGGNLFANNGRMYLYDGTVSFGTAGNHGGNIYLNAGYYTDGATGTTGTTLKLSSSSNGMTIAAQASSQLPVIMGGRALGSSSLGGNICATGSITLGRSQISGGYANSHGNEFALYRTSAARSPKLVVQTGYNQSLPIFFYTAKYNTNADTKFTLAHGKAISAMITASGALNGQLYVENLADQPALYVGANKQLTVSSGKLVDSQTGKVTWYPTLTEAAAQATGTKYAQAVMADTLTLSGDAQVDLNGYNLTATGTGTLYGFDSSNDDYNGFATVTGATAAPSFLAPNGNQYVTVTDDAGATSFHRLGQAISNVVLRPGKAGIYYKASWNCDTVLAEKITTQGVALSTAHMPDADLLTDGKVLRTERTADTPDTSVLVQNILKAGADNKDRGTKPIYAAAYTVVNGMTIVTQDGSQEKAGVSYTLQQVLENVDPSWATLTEGQQAGVKAMYAIAPDELATWSIPHITAGYQGVTPVRPLKILTLGSSSSVDSNHMINLVFANENYGQEILVGTLYHSGCQIPEHVDYLQNNTPAYDLYISSSTTPSKPPKIHRGVSMLDAITYADWDVIFLQPGSTENMLDETYTNGNLEIIRSYVNAHKTNPKAVFGWHTIGVISTDPDLLATYPYTPNSYITNAAKYNYDRELMLTERTSRMAEYVLTDPSYVYVVPTCTATENAITSYLGQKGLKRDYTHLTDVGRLIASYVWYCELTGIDHLDEIHANSIPKAFLKSTADKTQDRVLTQGEKAVILEAVNNTLKNPLEITPSQYTTEP